MTFPQAVFTTASERDLLWAAVVLEERGKVMVSGKRVSLTVNSVVSASRVPRLQSLFGGRAYAFGQRQIRWQLDGAELQRCVALLLPFVEAEGRALFESIANLDGALRPVETSSSALPPKVDAFNLLDGIDEDQLEAVVEWETIEKDADGRALLRSKGAEHTRQWCLMLNTKGFVCTVTGDSLIHVERKGQSE